MEVGQGLNWGCSAKEKKTRKKFQLLPDHCQGPVFFMSRSVLNCLQLVACLSFSIFNIKLASVVTRSGSLYPVISQIDNLYLHNLVRRLNCLEIHVNICAEFL
jgi:hypothetical protein